MLVLFDSNELDFCIKLLAGVGIHDNADQLRIEKIGELRIKKDEHVLPQRLILH